MCVHFGFDGRLVLPRFDGLPAYAAVNAGSDRLKREPLPGSLCT